MIMVFAWEDRQTPSIRAMNMKSVFMIPRSFGKECGVW
jgi:hypothetical protein